MALALTLFHKRKRGDIMSDFEIFSLVFMILKLVIDVMNYTKNK